MQFNGVKSEILRSCDPGGGRMVFEWQYYTKPFLSTRCRSSSCARASCLGHAFVYFYFMGSLCVSASYLYFLVFAFCIVLCLFFFILVVFALQMFLGSFPVQQTTYRIGNLVSYLVSWSPSGLLRRIYTHTQCCCYTTDFLSVYYLRMAPLLLLNNYCCSQLCDFMLRCY